MNRNALSWIAAVGMSWAVTAEAWQPNDNIRVHGFISQGYLKSSDNNFLARTEDGTFAFTEAGINVTSTLSDQLHAGVQLFSRRLGSNDESDMILDWAYGDYRWRDELGIRLGKIRTPVGFYNQVRDLDFLRTPALLPQSNYPELTRDIIFATSGGGLYGFIPMGRWGALDYEVVGGTVEIDGDSTFIRALTDAIGVTVLSLDINTEYAASGALRWQTPVDGLRFGVSQSSLRGDYRIVTPGGASVLDYDIEMRVWSVEYILDRWSFLAEYSSMDRAVNLPALAGPVPEFKPQGYYGQVAYRWNAWFESGVYYAEYFRDRDDRRGRKLAAVGAPDYMAWQKDLALTLRFDLSENWLLKLEAHHIDGGALVHPRDNLDGIEKSWQLYVVKTTFMF